MSAPYESSGDALAAGAVARDRKRSRRSGRPNRPAGPTPVLGNSEPALGPGASPTAREPGNRLFVFLRGSWAELQRVQWPDRRQVAQATGVVLGFVVVAAVFLGIADEISQKIVDAIL